MIENASNGIVVISDFKKKESLQQKLFGSVIFGCVLFYLYYIGQLDLLMAGFLAVLLLVFSFARKIKRASYFDKQHSVVVIETRWCFSRYIRRKEIPYLEIADLVLIKSEERGGLSYSPGLSLKNGDRQNLLAWTVKDHDEVMNLLQRTQTVLDRPIIKEDGLSWASHQKIF